MIAALLALALQLPPTETWHRQSGEDCLTYMTRLHRNDYALWRRVWCTRAPNCDRAERRAMDPYFHYGQGHGCGPGRPTPPPPPDTGLLLKDGFENDLSAWSAVEGEKP